MELKPCPFCGTNDEVVLSEGGLWPEGRCYYVKCRKCDAEGPTTKIGSERLKSVAVKSWNKRPNAEIRGGEAVPLD